uniref:DM2 domain-containing protein n=1 Tax=viral metagenome TaxID=1070528 RepID=A0A6C0CGW9_9ZZZZ
MAPTKKATTPEVKSVESKPVVEAKAVEVVKPVEVKAVEAAKVEAPKKAKTAPKAAAAQKTEEAAPVASTTDENSTGDEKTDGALNENVVQILADKIGNLAVIIKDIQASLKPVLKEHDKLRKIVERIQKKRDNARKSPSGFAKPNKISDELCDFIGVPHGTEKSRTDITRYINAYVKEHNLNKPTNRRIILPDEKLKKILKINNNEEVTFFILQRLISHHFPASGSKVAAAAAAAATVAT